MKNRGFLFDNYLTTHFQYNTDLSNGKMRREFEMFDKNIGSEVLNHVDQKILEIGFGTGYFIKYLMSKGYTNFDALEISEEEYEFVRTNITEQVILVTDTNKYLSENIDRYDSIYMFDVLEHIPKTDIVDLLRDISRSLKPHGQLFIRVPNAANPFNSQILFDDFTHEVYFTGTSLRQVCSIAGYKNIAILPWLEEDTSWISKLTNRSAPIMKQFLYAFMGFSRLYFNPNNPMSRNIFCICSK